MDIINNVIRAMDGDQEAISELYYTTYPKLRAVAVSILKNESDADDIVQDSYIKAFSSLHQLDNAKKFEPWLCRIVSNKCKDYLKKNKPVLFSSHDNEENDEPIEWSIEDDSKEYDPEAVLISADTRQQIMDLLDSLPDDQRICLIYHVVQEMKISEIAELLEVSESTVKSRINYAKSKMKVKINELEKKGVKLRGFAGFALFPFIRHLFASQSTSVPPISTEIVTGSMSGAAEATAVITETVASSSSAVIGETAKTVVGQAVQHLGLKIISGVVAVAIATTTITGIINPKLLYPIDVFNIIESAPIKVIEKFEDGFNDGDVNKMIECLEPDIQEEVYEGKYVADDFLGEFLGTSTEGVFGIIADFSECDIVADKNSSQIGSDTAKIIADINFSVLNFEDTISETIFMKKIDGKWYITDNHVTVTSDEDTNCISTLTNEKLSELNNYISYFSEQGIQEYPMSDDRMFSFALVFHKLYGSLYDCNASVCTNFYACQAIDKSLIDDTTERFFGKTVAIQNSAHVVFDSGIYHTEAADGQSYYWLSIAKELYAIDENTYKVIFNIYEDTDGEAGGKVTNLDYYSFNVDIANKTPSLKLAGDGYAIIKNVGEAEEKFVLTEYKENWNN